MFSFFWVKITKPKSDLANKSNYLNKLNEIELSQGSFQTQSEIAQSNKFIINPAESILLNAKQLIKNTLKSRIDTWENHRAKDSALVRNIKWLFTGYGETGYLRTRRFLKEMDNVNSIPELVRLIGRPDFCEGNDMPEKLRNCLFQITGVTNQHIHIVMQKESGRSLYIGTYDPGISNIARQIIAKKDAEDILFEKIVNSTDAGKSHLAELLNPANSKQRNITKPNFFTLGQDPRHKKAENSHGIVETVKSFFSRLGF